MNPMQFWVQVAEQWQKAWADSIGLGGERRRGNIPPGPLSGGCSTLRMPDNILILVVAAAETGAG